MPAPAAEAGGSPAAMRRERSPSRRRATIGAYRRWSPGWSRSTASTSSRIPGTGIGGRVSKRDVLEVSRFVAPRRLPADVPGSGCGAAAHDQERPRQCRDLPPERPVAPPAPAARPGRLGGYHSPVYQPREGDIVEAFTRRRKLIAEHMVFSKTHSPHVGTLAEVDLTKLMRLREAHKRPSRSARVSRSRCFRSRPRLRCAR